MTSLREHPELVNDMASLMWGQGGKTILGVREFLQGCDDAVCYETVRRRRGIPRYAGRLAAQRPLRRTWRFLSRLATRVEGALWLFRGGLSDRPDLWGGPVWGGYNITVWAISGDDRRIEWEIVVSPDGNRMKITLPDGTSTIVRDVATALRRIDRVVGAERARKAARRTESVSAYAD